MFNSNPNRSMVDMNPSTSSTSTASNSPHFKINSNERLNKRLNIRPHSMYILDDSHSPPFISNMNRLETESKPIQHKQQTQKDENESQQRIPPPQQPQQSSRSSKSNNKSSNSFFTRIINRLNTNKSNNQQHQNPSPLAKCDNFK